MCVNAGHSLPSVQRMHTRALFSSSCLYSLHCFTRVLLIGWEMQNMTKIEALAKHLELSEDEISEIEECTYGDDSSFEYGNATYRVLDDDEADQAWDESLDSYIDDCILPECKDKTLAQYFDRDAWKRDAKHDGRGHSLSSYDGEENEVRAPDGTYFYIYRTN